MKFNFLFVIGISLLIISFSGQNALGYGGPPEQNSANNYTVDISQDEESYDLGESITFSGTVNKFDEERNLRISIFDFSKNLVITQKIPVNPDASFSHNVILNEKFLEGKYVVKAQYGNSKATVESISFLINSDNFSDMGESSSTGAKIPDWIKSNAGWWADGQIDDNSFVEGIQFLIKEGLLKIPSTDQGSSSTGAKIPDWIKSNAGWWADDQIDDSSFVEGIQFLIKEGLMTLSS